MSDFAMHYRTIIEQNNEKPVSQKANENVRRASEKVEEIKNFHSTKKCSKQNVVSALNHGDSSNKSNQNLSYVTIGYDCLFVDDDADEEEVFKNRPKVEKKSKKLKIKRNKNSSAHGSNQEEISGKNNTHSADSGHEPAVAGNYPKQTLNKRAYKESTSIDSGIECESNPNYSEISGNFLQNIDNNFSDFLLDNEDRFLDYALDYVSPKFSCNRFDNILAFTLHAKNVVVDTIECQKLVEIGAARIKFYSASSQQHYAFFVKITPPLHNSSVLSQHFNENNNTAMVTNVSAETWDNNVVLQIELDSVIARDVEEYYCGVSKYELEPKQLTAKVLHIVPEPSHAENRNDGQEDEGLSIKVENSSESEISIAIKGKENEMQTSTSAGAAMKRRNKKKKNRSYSESCCDELKVISESEALNEQQLGRKEQDILKNNVNVPRKARSISECAYNSEEADHHIKYKSILKHSSFDSSADDLFYSTSFDIQMNGGGSTDPEMSESCKKSVRFSEHITRQLYRSTSSILAQKKKNQRKNEAKRRLLERKNSECESADEEKEINDIPENEPPEEEEEDVTHIEMTTKSKKNKKKRGLETTKSNMIFDLEI